MMSFVSCGKASGNMFSDRMARITCARIQFAGRSGRAPAAGGCDSTRRPRRRAGCFPSMTLRSPLLQRLPFQQADPVRVLAGGLNQKGRLSAGSPDKLSAHACRSAILRRNTARNKSFLVAEIVVEHPLVDGRAPGDGVHARAGKSVRREFLQGGGQNAAAGAFGIPRRGSGRSVLLVLAMRPIK